MYNHHSRDFIEQFFWSIFDGRFPIRMLNRRMRGRFQVLGRIGIKCYQWSNGNDFALVFIDSIIVCMLLKLWAKIINRDVEFTWRGTLRIGGMYQKVRESELIVICASKSFLNINQSTRAVLYATKTTI